jgi:hypothetical protein
MTFWHPTPIPLILQLTRARSPASTCRALEDIGAFLICFHDARQYGPEAAPGMDALAEMVGGKRGRAGEMKKAALSFLEEFESTAKERRAPAPTSRPAAVDPRQAEAERRAAQAEEYGRQLDIARRHAEARAEAAEAAQLEAIGRAARAEEALRTAQASLRALQEEHRRLRATIDGSPTPSRRPADDLPTPARHHPDAGPMSARRRPDVSPTPPRHISDIGIPSLSEPLGVSSDMEPTPARHHPDAAPMSARRRPDTIPTPIRSATGGTDDATRPPVETPTLTSRSTSTSTLEEEEPTAAPRLHPLPDGALDSLSDSKQPATASTLTPEDVLEAWHYAWCAVNGRNAGAPPEQPGGADARNAADIARRYGVVSRDRLQAAGEQCLRDWQAQPPAKRWPSDYPTLTTWQAGIAGWLARVPSEEPPPADIDADSAAPLSSMPAPIAEMQSGFWRDFMRPDGSPVLPPELAAWWGAHHPEMLATVRAQLANRLQAAG